MSEERATLEELQEFANKVREAGGGNPLDALMPAVPQDPKQCLIAKNLNFNCTVQPSSTNYGDDYENPNAWLMILEDHGVRDSIADSLGLEKTDYVRNEWKDGYKDVTYPAVKLPAKYARVAQDFDIVQDFVHIVSGYSQYLELTEEESLEESAAKWYGFEGHTEIVTLDEAIEHWINFHGTERMRTVTDELVKEMLPYIQGSIKESYMNASIVNEDGSIVI